jgi:hypothetical protein
MIIEKLPVPEFELLTEDVGSEFQEKMNAAMLGVKNAIIAFNAQIDANETSTDRVSQMNSLIQQVELDSNNAIVQVLTSTDAEVEVEFGGQTQLVVPYGYLREQVEGSIDSAFAYAQSSAASAAASGTLAKFYPTVEAGLAAVGEGDYFQVPATTATEFTIVYQKVGSVAIEKKRSPSGVAITALVNSMEELATAAPLVKDWLDITLDKDGLFVSGRKKDLSFWECRAGELVKIAALEFDPADLSLQLPNWNFLDTFVPLVSDWSELYVDKLGNFVKGIKRDGSIYESREGILVNVASKTFSKLTVTDDLELPLWSFLDTSVPLVSDWHELHVDKLGNIVKGIKSDGSVYVAKEGALQPLTPTDASSVQGLQSYLYSYLDGTALNADSNIDYLIMINGQSWAEGGKSGFVSDATVTINPEHPGFALMFDAGVKPAGAPVSSFVDLKETENYWSYETPASGIADVLMSRLSAKFDRKPRIIFASAAMGGQAYLDSRTPTSGLKRGTSTYSESLRLVDRARNISSLQGRKLVVLAQVIIHGEQDFTNATSKAFYMRALEQWQSDFEEDCQAITGQRTHVKAYVTQVNRGGAAIGSPAQVALAQLAVEDRNSKIRCCGPLYQAPGGTDGAHLRAVGYRMIGRLVGHFIYSDGFGPYAQPLRVIDYWWASSTTVHLQYSMPVFIETSDELVTVSTLGADKGIKFTDGSAIPPTVINVEVSSSASNQIIVTLSAVPTGKNPRLYIAAHRAGGGGSGSINGARSAIRSVSPFDSDTLTGITQYFWACQEQINLTI